MAGEVLPIEYWLLDLPLYSPVEIGSDINKAIKAILMFKKTMDSYCPGCKQSATFNAVISVDTEKAAQDEIRNIKQRSLAKAAGSSLVQRDVWQLVTTANSRKLLAKFDFVNLTWE